ncbi:AAA family ATPase [Anaeromyxobacter paludicola]|uniref:ATPase n=1 Tax=Anaeromyxobacter paludicola TaxID=2918171 RepID=A0ABN6N661_9BACT|nr:AAA family ATPase [Anaeromyxobacter paludicola]BDG08651.1 ATPase [Anaeromyxobacter paludicola]
MTSALQPIQQLSQDLNARFPERREVIDGALCAVLAGEHLLLLGPPGTAKSALVRAIAQAFEGSYFERLLTRFSTPEELFGPVSLKALEQDRYARVVAGKLPEAQFAFVDEVFKANSAILNSLLTAMNERLFHNDGAPVQMPLVSLFGASNELPDGKELEALFDRFLLRFDVQYLRRPSSFRAVVTGSEPTASLAFPFQALQDAQAAAAAVIVTDATVDALLAIRDACTAEGIVASDRRWKKSLRVVQAHAFLAGESATTPEDLLVLVDALWREPKERAKVARLVGELADPVSAKAAEILDAARETAAKVAGLRSSDRKAYIASAAQALDDFKAQQARLADLARGAGPRAKATLADAGQEIAQLHSDLARSVTHGLGLAGAR